MRIKIKEICGKNIITREDGKKINAIIMEHWNTDERIEIDFGNIMIASVSFMDESLGVLGLKYLKEEIISRIKVVNITKQDRKLLNDIIVSRLKERRQNRSEVRV